jgi:hypothetical protein
MPREKALSAGTPAERAAAIDKRSADVLAQEDGRRAADAAKTARLRALRLAKEAGEPKGKTRPTGRSPK